MQRLEKLRVGDEKREHADSASDGGCGSDKIQEAVQEVHLDACPVSHVHGRWRIISEQVWEASSVKDDEHHDAECSRHTWIDFGFAHGSRKQGGAGAVTFTTEKGQSKKLALPGRRDQGNRLRVTERGRPRSRRMTEREASSSSVHFVPNSSIVVSVSLLIHG